ncbi:hypothetical protein G6L16_021450 [Agrobacterium tumefaciens]|uniref:hypothetical protein n=1 Tax=Agrobacterium tumefaciens TaxID=358 RepID=UPI00157193BF|nr:hypothetical protein [Agrobacterium tumefaciens]NSZ64611.1 hypothetical protein [Agrobacterium tumefaciens]NTA70981.1 hypothetical protein [Agrobacterium tumefaciens]WIE40766.1 hypothetical protein G6L16_021450 [Agrobacterium tumefaciens]
MGVTAEVFSGGQPGIEEGGNRVGSVRHDHGGAGDMFFYKDGRKLDWANDQDRPIFEQIVSQGKANGITGFGAGPGYMQAGSMHVGMGKPGVWGAGGKGDNAPSWLQSAYNGAPSQSKPDVISEVIAAADPASAPTQIPGTETVALAQKPEEPKSRNGVLIDAYNKLTGSDVQIGDKILGMDTDKMTKGFSQIGDFAKTLAEQDAALNSQIQATARAQGGRIGGGNPVEIAAISSLPEQQRKRRGGLSGLGGFTL